MAVAQLDLFAPVAESDEASTPQDETVEVDVIANDRDPDLLGGINKKSVDLDLDKDGRQDSLTTPDGKFKVNDSGVVKFDPEKDFIGVVSIPYTVEDKEGKTSNVATITITVTAPVNAAPIAMDDETDTEEGKAVTINVVGNDSDSDGSIEKSTVDLNVSQSGIQNSNNTAQGNYAVNSNGVVTFTPAVNFSGSASITYTVNDNDGATSNVATLTISVSSVNDPPVAADDNASTSEGTAVSFNIILNDSDNDGSIDATSVDLNPNLSGTQKSVATPQGTFAVNNAGVVTFNPPSNFSGEAAIDYTVRDNDNAISNVATITVEIGASNNAPVAADDNASTGEGTPVSFNIVANDSDSDGTIDASTIDLDPAASGSQKSNNTPQGNFSVSGSGILTFTPANGFSGQASIGYTVKDNEGATSNVASITVNVNFVNVPPIAADDNVTTGEGITVTFNIIENDTDSDGTIDASSVDLNLASSGVQKNNNTSQGNFSVDNSGIVTFAPAAGFSGLASINYAVKDNESATSNIANITVTVSSVNIPPVAVADMTNTNEGNSVSFNILTNDADNDGNLVASTVDLNPATGGIQKEKTTAQGNFVVNNSGVVTYTPSPSFFGDASIDYTVQDNEGATSNSAQIQVIVGSINASPVATDDDASTQQGAAISLNIVENDSDSDGTVDATSVDLNPSEPGIQKNIETPEGNFLVNESGTLTYTPPLEFLGVAVINYTVLDNEGAFSNAASIRIEVGYEGAVNLDIPTGFTPNGDGANETWKIQPRDKGSLDYFPDAEIRVFSKRGVLVYEARGFDKAWDGRYQGTLLPADSYFYTIDLKRANKRHKGVVTILR